MKMGTCILFIFTCISASVHPQVPQYIPADSLVDYARENIPSCGSIAKTSAGFIYLKVSNQYMKNLLPKLKDLLGEKEGKNLVSPEETEDFLGPHVAIIYPSELKEPVRSLPERGRKACFTINGLYYIDFPEGLYQRIYFFSLVSSDMQKIRKNYGLAPLYKNKNFRLAIGVVTR